MKNVLLLICLLLSLSKVSGQAFRVDPDTEDHTRNYQYYRLDTISTSSLSKKQLYSNSLSFIDVLFPKVKNVIQMKDLELGEILFSASISKTYRDTVKSSKKEKVTVLRAYLYFKCKIYLKDGKFKIILYNLGGSKDVDDIYPRSLDIPYLSHKITEEGYNRAARDLALSFINDISAWINRKPESDF